MAGVPPVTMIPTPGVGNNAMMGTGMVPAAMASVLASRKQVPSSCRRMPVHAQLPRREATLGARVEVYAFVMQLPALHCVARVVEASPVVQGCRLSGVRPCSQCHAQATTTRSDANGAWQQAHEARR